MSTSEQTLLILETERHVEGLINAFKYFAEPREIGVSVQFVEYGESGALESGIRDDKIKLPAMKPLSKDKATEILLALVEELMGQYLRYKVPESSIPKIAKVLFDTHTPNEIQHQVAEDYLCLEETDGVVMDLHIHLGKLIGGEPWRQWNLIRASNLIALMGGKDYRIAEWERYHGQDHDELIDGEAVVNIGLHEIGNYIYSKLIEVAPGIQNHIITVTPIIVDALTRKMLNIEFIEEDRNITLFDIQYQLSRFTNMDYERFYYEYVKQLIDSFISTFVAGRMYGRGAYYKGEVKKNMTLVLYKSRMPQDVESRYYYEIQESLERGDYVPESDRRKLEEYKRTHGL